MSQQCDMTAKKANVMFATDNRSAVSSSRELQISCILRILCWAGHHTAKVMGSVPTVPYLRVILINESDSRAGSDQKGKGPGKLVLKTGEMTVWPGRAKSWGRDDIQYLMSCYWQSSDLKGQKQSRSAVNIYRTQNRMGRLSTGDVQARPTIVNSDYTLETPGDVLTLSKPKPHPQLIKLESLGRAWAIALQGFLMCSYTWQWPR